MTLLKSLQKTWKHLDAYRLIHGTTDGCTGLIIDVYAGHYLLTLEQESWLKEQATLRESLERLHSQSNPNTKAKFYWVANFPNKRELLPSDPAETFLVQEGELYFEVHLGEGPHTGLFLDQYENRQHILETSRKKRVLNLFSYTGAFSVAALKGGASEVVSVDLSKNSLKWMERNLAANQLKVSQSKAIPNDVFTYLKAAELKKDRFDLIILDPPTFSRSKSKTFSTEHDFAGLVQRCLSLLNPKGSLLASINSQKISVDQFRKLIKLALEGSGKKILKTIHEQENPNLKYAWLGD